MAIPTVISGGLSATNHFFVGTFLLSVSAGADGLSAPDLCVCLLQAFALVGSPKALHIST